MLRSNSQLHNCLYDQARAHKYSAVQYINAVGGTLCALATIIHHLQYTMHTFSVNFSLLFYVRFNMNLVWLVLSPPPSPLLLHPNKQKTITTKLISWLNGLQKINGITLVFSIKSIAWLSARCYKCITRIYRFVQRHTNKRMNMNMHNNDGKKPTV